MDILRENESVNIKDFVVYLVYLMFQITAKDGMIIKA